MTYNLKKKIVYERHLIGRGKRVRIPKLDKIENNKSDTRKIEPNEVDFKFTSLFAMLCIFYTCKNTDYSNGKILGLIVFIWFFSEILSCYKQYVKLLKESK